MVLHTFDMPTRPPRYHAREPAQPQAATPTRPSSHARGYDRRWRRLRAAHLSAHPLCVECERAGIVTVATEVDHIRPHRGNATLLYDPDNLQSMCKPHHSAKTARGQ